jgi:hypothetical protein
MQRAIKSRLRQMGQTQEWLAGQLGIGFNTFRAHLDRNTFYRKEADAIIEALGLGTVSRYKFELLKGEYRAKVRTGATLVNLFHRMDAATSRLKRVCRQVRDDWLATTELLRENDLLIVFSATLTPLEMEDNRKGMAFRRAIARSIRNGGRFIYFRPDPGTLRKYTNDFRLSKVDLPEQQVNQFKYFQEEVAELVRRDDGDPKLAYARLAQFYPKRCPFWSPGVSFGLTRTFDTSGQAVGHVSIRIPDDPQRGQGEPVLLSWNHELAAARMASTAESLLNCGLSDAVGQKRDMPRLTGREEELAKYARDHLREDAGVGDMYSM